MAGQDSSSSTHSSKPKRGNCLFRTMGKVLRKCKRAFKLSKSKGSYHVTDTPLKKPKQKDGYRTDARANVMQDVLSTENTTKRVGGTAREMLQDLNQRTDSEFSAFSKVGRAVEVNVNAQDISNKTPFQDKSTKVRSAPEFTFTENVQEVSEELISYEILNVKTVAENLTRDCQSNTEKARVLFRWVVARDLRDRLSANKPPRYHYHQLYQKLCRFSGLQCEIIRGYSKGAGYKPGMRIENNSFRNCWTAVSIDNRWRLVNCTWAARHSASNDSKKIDEFYFMTDPREHIYQHFPDDPVWQLLDVPISMETFVQLPHLKSQFFNSGLSLVQDTQSAILSTNHSEIRIAVPDLTDLGWSLSSSEHSKETTADWTSLHWENNIAVFTIYSPQPGTSYFSVYAGEFGNDLESACCFLT